MNNTSMSSCIMNNEFLYYEQLVRLLKYSMSIMTTNTTQVEI